MRWNIFNWRRSPAKPIAGQTRKPNPESAIDFFSIPNDILIALLQGWLSCKEFSELDVTICSRRVRQQWLDLLKDPVLRVDLGFQQPPTLGCYTWMVKRQLSTTVLYLNVSIQFLTVQPPTAGIETVVLMGAGHDATFNAYGHATLLKRFPNMTKLTSRGLSVSFGGNTLRDLATLPVALKELEIVDTGTAVAHFQCAFNLAVFAIVFRYGSTLEVLHLQVSNMTSEADSELMSQIRTRCSVLRVLRLPGISFHYYDVLELSASHSKLTGLECKVDFSRCPDPKPTQTACLDILERFPLLEQLSVFGKGVAAPSLSLKQFPKLKTFATDQLSLNMSPSDSSLTINGDCVEAQTACQFLLDVPIAVKSIICKGANLSGTISNENLLAIAAKHGCALSRLINFNYAKVMDDATLKQFLIHCPRIVTLELPVSPDFTCDAALHIANHCSKFLESLVISIRSLTDSAIVKVLIFCTNLKRLCILNGVLITSAVFDHVSSLTMLGITGGQSIATNEVIAAITAGKFRTLSVLKFPQSDLLQYSAVAARLTAGAEKLKIEEFRSVKEFL